jgi:hypothetical protein
LIPTNINLLSLQKKINIEGIKLQDEIPQKGINISFLSIVSLAIILGIKHHIVKLMENTIIKMFKYMVIRTTRIIIIKRIETIIHSLHYKITMLNATNAKIMVTNLVIVDYQSFP